MIRSHRALTLTVGLAAVLTVAACSSGAHSTGTTAATTATVTQSASSAAPPTGSGVPASPSATASGTGSGGNQASGPGLCTPTVMTFAVGKPDGAAGTSYVAITATNASASPCVTTGYPGVALLDASGHQFLQAQRDATVQSATLTVAPGGTVTTRLAVGDVSSNGAACTASPAILFTLPDNTDSTKLTLSEPSACSAKVQALVSGSGS